MAQSNRSRYTTRRPAVAPAPVRTQIRARVQTYSNGLPDCPTLRIQRPGFNLFICVNKNTDGSHRVGAITTIHTPDLIAPDIRVHSSDYEAREALEQAIGWLQFPSVRAATQPQQVAA